MHQRGSSSVFVAVLVILCPHWRASAATVLPRRQRPGRAAYVPLNEWPRIMRRIRDLYYTIFLLMGRVGRQALIGFEIVIWFQKLSGIQVVSPGRVSRLRWTL